MSSLVIILDKDPEEFFDSVGIPDSQRFNYRMVFNGEYHTFAEIKN